MTEGEGEDLMAAAAVGSPPPPTPPTAPPRPISPLGQGEFDLQTAKITPSSFRDKGSRIHAVVSVGMQQFHLRVAWVGNGSITRSDRA